MRDFMEELAIPICCLVLLFCLIIGSIFGPIVYYSSCQEARIYNQQHNTHYTCRDFFWAGEQINAGTHTIELKR